MKRFITPYIYNYAKKIMPKISETEAAALNSGSVSIEGKIFEGKLKLKDIVEKYDIKLNDNENKYLNNQTNNLCEMINNESIEENQNLSKNDWDYIRNNKFMGLVISKKYGGLEFGAHAHSKIVEKIATRNYAAAVTVMVPNSLGPGELLYNYGTDEQKNYYLPRLANGIDIPCFGLTTENSGSDAASMYDTGIVVKEKEILGIRVSFSKRYITLAPVATLIGLAFKLKDPDNLLIKGKEGITLALIPKETNKMFPFNSNNIDIGNRHNPLNVGFMNGTIVGKSLFIPMSSIIGGEEKCGYGWNMLMESLGEGRGISLPALSVASAKLCTFGVGGYSRIRKQFNLPIAEMEGVKEKLSVIAMKNYQLLSAQTLFNSIIANNEKPQVLSAIMKYQCTEYGRISINNGMDILGGAAICKGSKNFLASSYMAIPIAITVEGSNTLTRSLIIFGQGLNRSHPYLLDIIKTIQNKNELDKFHIYLLKIINHTLTNLSNSLYYSVSLKLNSKKNKLEYYEQNLNRLVSNFAFSTNIALLMGGKLKTAEYISGRYADILINIYMSYACLWYYEKNKNVKNIDKLLEICINEHFINIQEAIYEISDNFPIPLVGKIIKYATFPLGKDYKKHNDKLTSDVSDLITKSTEVRDLLTENLFISKNEDDRLNQIMNCMILEDKYNIIKKQTNISDNDNKIIEKYENLKNEIIKVNTF